MKDFCDDLRDARAGIPFLFARRSVQRDFPLCGARTAVGGISSRPNHADRGHHSLYFFRIIFQALFTDNAAVLLPPAIFCCGGSGVLCGRGAMK